MFFHHLKQHFNLRILILLLCCAHSPLTAQLSKYRPYFVKDQTPGPDTTVHITFFGVSTLLFDDGENQILVDGFFTRPSLLKVALGKVQTDTALIRNIFNDYHISRLKGVFVTHSHYDHALDAGFVSRTTGAHLYGSLSTVQVGAGAGVPQQQLHEYVLNKPIIIGRFSVTPVQSRHSKPTVFNNDLGEQIQQPLHQPAKATDYSEGGTYDLLIRHSERSFLVKASANFVEGALEGHQADTVFLATATLGKQNTDFKERYYQTSVKNAKARTVIPLHWDNFFRPLAKKAKFFPRIGDNNPRAFDFLIKKTQADGVDFKILLPGHGMSF